MEGSVWPNKNEEVTHRRPVLTNARAHARIADRLAITEFIAESVALRNREPSFPVVRDSSNLVFREGQRIDEAFAWGHLG